MRSSIKSFCKLSRLIFAGGVLFVVAGTASHAQITTNGCGDASSDFGENCSLAELYQSDANFIQVDDTRFGYFTKNDFNNPDNGDNPPPIEYDRAKVRVVGLDDIENQPGLRLDFLPGTFVADQINPYGAGAFINIVAETAPAAPFQSFTWISGNLTSHIDSKPGTTSPDYSGGCVGGAFGATEVFIGPRILGASLIPVGAGNLFFPEACDPAQFSPPPVENSYVAQTDFVGIGINLFTRVDDADIYDGFEGYAENSDSRGPRRHRRATAAAER